MRALVVLVLLLASVPSSPTPRPRRTDDVVDPHGAGPIARPIVARR